MRELPLTVKTEVSGLMSYGFSHCYFVQDLVSYRPCKELKDHTTCPHTRH